MRKHLTCQTPSRFVRVAWIALPPNGDVSFGLNDKTYISPRFKNRKFAWSAYNRVTAQFEVSSSPNSLEPVKNPHFTYHQPHWFNLKSDKTKAHKDEQLFAGICEVPLVLPQQEEMPWLRATTAQLNQLRSAGLRWSKVPNDDLPFMVRSEDISIKIAIDFIRPEAAFQTIDANTWRFIVGSAAIESLSQRPRLRSLRWGGSTVPRNPLAAARVAPDLPSEAPVVSSGGRIRTSDTVSRITHRDALP
jgi:hypothetical protein